MLTTSDKLIKTMNMKQYTKYCFAFVLLLAIGSCKKKEYSMGDLAAPTQVTINTEIVGVDATHPNGDGSGDVKITLTGNNVLSYKIDYDAADGIDLQFLANGKNNKKIHKDRVEYLPDYRGCLWSRGHSYNCYKRDPGKERLHA